jgi:hypothetical protein
MVEPEFRLPAFDEGRHERPRPRRRAMAIGVAAAVTVGGLGAALYVGTLGYDMQRNRRHETRLKNILAQTPTVYQVTEGLKEKAPLLLVIEGPNDLERALSQWGEDKADEIRTKASAWPQLRVYEAGDMIYFIYFDDGNIMRDYVCVSS